MVPAFHPSFSFLGLFLEVLGDIAAVVEVLIEEGVGVLKNGAESLFKIV